MPRVPPVTNAMRPLSLSPTRVLTDSSRALSSMAAASAVVEAPAVLAEPEPDQVALAGLVVLDLAAIVRELAVVQVLELAAVDRELDPQALVAHDLAEGGERVRRLGVERRLHQRVALAHQARREPRAEPAVAIAQ